MMIAYLATQKIMARPHKVRKITKVPAVSFFKPDEDTGLEAIFLLYEEYESLRLMDYEKCDQTEAASVMQVSRPTFTRIYKSAREKIAKAFVEGRKMIIEGGKIEIGKNWYSCYHCKCDFNIPDDVSYSCPLCGSIDIKEYADS